ncbi:hypothetical protein QQF64_013440 [Cirrhinus molitorella]|uniref:Uncharacterized protein n=2 Tax=Cirrhinus TaxID=59897 RepID=A0ABR3LR71_9TELE
MCKINKGRIKVGCVAKRSESFDGWGPQEVAALFDNFSHSTQPQGDKPPEIRIAERRVNIMSALDYEDIQRHRGRGGDPP